MILISLLGTGVVARVDPKFGSTIRHANCELLMSADDEQQIRCCHCRTYRKSLHSMLSRHNSATSSSTSRLSHDSHVNYRFLSPSEKDARLQNLHTIQRATKLKLDRLSAKISKVAS